MRSNQVTGPRARPPGRQEGLRLSGRGQGGRGQAVRSATRGGGRYVPRLARLGAGHVTQNFGSTSAGGRGNEAAVTFDDVRPE